ncbi:MAG: hypothetical protein JWN41_234, partial [Thermoleophilia bacterium]|nr:hypothetical protein [Thermoleophilia bacterium]
MSVQSEFAPELLNFCLLDRRCIVGAAVVISARAARNETLEQCGSRFAITR